MTYRKRAGGYSWLGGREPGSERGSRVAFVARQTHGRGDDRGDLAGEGRAWLWGRELEGRGLAGTPDGPGSGWASWGGGRSVMGGRGLGVVVGVVGLVAVIGVSRGGSHRPPPPTSAAERVWPEEAQVEPDASPTTVAAASTTTPSTAEIVGVEGQAAALEAGGEEEAMAPADQWRALLATDAPRAGLYRLIGDPASSDLPPAVAARAASTGSVFVVADATGVGREAFPGWWGDRSSEPVAATARVLAAGAATYGPLVQVVVVWDGSAPDGEPLGERTSTVFLAATASDGFVPVHPGEVG